MANETKTRSTPKALAAGQPLERADIAADGTVNVRHGKAQLLSVDVADVDLLLTFADGAYVVIPNGALDAISGTPHNVTFNDGKGILGDLFKQAGTTAAAKAGSLRLVSESIDAAPPPADEISAELAPPEQAPTVAAPAPPAPLAKVGAGTAAGNGQAQSHGAEAGTGASENDVAQPIQAVQIVEPPVYTSGTQQAEQTVTVPNLFDSLSSPPTASVALFTSSSFKLTGATGTPDGAWIAPPATPYGDPAYITDRAVYAQQLANRSAPVSQAARATISGTGAADSIIHNSSFSSADTQWVRVLHLDTTNFTTISQIVIRVNGAFTSIPGFDIQGTGVTHVAGTNQWTVDPTAISDLLSQGLNLNIVYNVSDDAAYLASAATILSSSVTVSGTHIENGITVTPSVTTSFQLISSDAVSQADYTVPVTDPIYGTTMMVLPRSGVGYDIYAGDGDDIVNAGAGADLVKGEAGDDKLNGGSGNDTLNGGLGADTLVGGAGTDTATYADAGTGVTVVLDGSGSGAAGSESFGDTLAGIENLIGTNYADTLTGNAGANVISGGADSDVLDGAAGADTLNGGDGDDLLKGGDGADSLQGGGGTDTASYASATAAVTVSLTTNTGTRGEASGDVLASVENLIGGAGDDVFTGAAGVQANAFDGGGGNDTVSYAPSTQGVVASLTTGLSGVAQTNDASGDTFANIENLTGSALADTLIGNIAAINVLSGGAGNDVLEGLGGTSDVLDGGADSDTASYLHASTGVVASLTSGLVAQSGDAVGDTYTSIENLQGSSLADTLIGDTANNTLTGEGGDDLLEGYAGADALFGGDGSDTASYAHAMGGVTASLTTGLATQSGDAKDDRYDSVENLAGSGYDDTLIGNTSTNTLSGGAGNDTLEGIGGNDRYFGGDGSNTVSYAHASETVTGNGIGVTASLLNPGSNLGAALGDTYDLIQNLSGSAYDDLLSGDTGNNILTGDGGDDTLDGGAGSDMLYGGAGDDSLTGGTGADTLYGGDGNDTLSDDGIGAATLDGGAGDDTITITAGSLADTTLDSFIGGSGVDTLLWTGTGTLSAINLQNGGSLSGAYGSITSRASGTGFENVTATSANAISVYLSTADNVITGGTSSNDAVDFSYANSAVTATLADFGTTNQAAVSYAATGNGVDVLIGIDNLYCSASSAFNDRLTGNAGNNILSGGAGMDILSGLAGNDTLYGGASTDTLYGGDGNDMLDGGAGADFMDGGIGTDYVRYDLSNTAAVNASLLGTALSFTFSGIAAGDTYSGIEGLYGSAAGDLLWGDGGTNTLYGQAGDDTLEGFSGADVFDGGAGTDTVSYAHSGWATAGSATTAAGTGVTANLTTTTGATGDAIGDTFNLIENLTGSDYDDTLTGSTAANVLDGGAGNDSLSGGDGNDSLIGGAGNDILDGGLGNDTLAGGAGNDAIAATVGDSATGGLGDDTFSVTNGSFSLLPTLFDGGGGSNDTLLLQGLTGGAYSLAPLAAVTDNMEILNIRSDSVNTALTLTSADIQAFVDNGNGSTLTIQAGTGDTLVISQAAGETVNHVDGSTDYTIMSGTIQVAQIHWLAA